MEDVKSRRKFLARSAAFGVTLGIAGCLGTPGDTGATSTDTQTETQTETPTETPTDEVHVENPEPASDEVFAAWEPVTDCKDGKPESMYNSEISVQNVVNDQPDSINPIAYDGLPNEEKRIIAEVLEDGGYATCDTSGAFQSFLKKAVYEYADKQDGDEMSVWIAYEENYYKLYIRKQDQVYAY